MTYMFINHVYKLFWGEITRPQHSATPKNVGADFASNKQKNLEYEIFNQESF